MPTFCMLPNIFFISFTTCQRVILHASNRYHHQSLICNRHEALTSESYILNKPTISQAEVKIREINIPEKNRICGNDRVFGKRRPQTRGLSFQSEPYLECLRPEHTMVFDSTMTLRLWNEPPYSSRHQRNPVGIEIVWPWDTCSLCKSIPGKQFARVKIRRHYFGNV